MGTVIELAVFIWGVEAQNVSSLRRATGSSRPKAATSLVSSSHHDCAVGGRVTVKVGAAPLRLTVVGPTTSGCWAANIRSRDRPADDRVSRGPRSVLSSRVIDGAELLFEAVVVTKVFTQSVELELNQAR